MPIVDIINNNYIINNYSISSIPYTSNDISINEDIHEDNSDSSSNSSIDSNKHNFLDNNCYFIKLKNNNLKSKKNIRKLLKI